MMNDSVIAIVVYGAFATAQVYSLVGLYSLQKFKPDILLQGSKTNSNDTFSLDYEEERRYRLARIEEQLESPFIKKEDSPV